jgi:hypothetical protein
VNTRGSAASLPAAPANVASYFRDRRILWLTHADGRGNQGMPALRARTSRHRALPSPPKPRACLGGHVIFRFR